MVERSFYKKTGLTTMALARELLCSTEGERLPTIAAYVESLRVSRGTVQDAFAILEQDGCLKIGKHGQRGSVVERLDKRRLIRYADLDALTASMPVPLNDPLRSLATAVCRVMSNCPVPFTFAFIEGAAKRVQALQRMQYDFVVVSAMTAHSALKQYPELEIAIQLPGCVYSPDYVLCINRPRATGLTPDMLVGFDPNCTDQVTLLEYLTRGEQVQIQAMPYLGCKASLLDGTVDATIYRRESWMEGLRSATILPIVGSSYNSLDMNTPALLTNQNNYSMARLLRGYLDEKRLQYIQQEVLNQRIQPEYY